MCSNLFIPSSTIKAPRMRFQERDEDILNAIQRYGGVLAKRQLKELFWPDKTWRAMEKRLAKLHDGGYVNWPARNEWWVHPVPEPVCWLGWKGASLLARELGADIGGVPAENENRQRKLEQVLRRAGFHWIREPRWLQLKHDLRVVDFRMAIERAVRQHPSLSLGGWILEREFRADPDTVEYEFPARGGQTRKARKAVVPDGFFSIQNNQRLIEAHPYTARFLVEIDMSTEDNPRFAREKFKPSVAYLRSSKFQQRFGYKSGRWLIVAQSAQRLRNLMKQAASTLGSDAAIFYFTTFESLLSVNALSGRIWYRGSEELVRPLLDV